MPASNFTPWITQIPEAEKRFAIEGGATNNIRVVFQPVSPEGKAVSAIGSLSFEYYIGLPKISDVKPLRDFRWFSSGSAINSKIVSRMSEDGLNGWLGGGPVGPLEFFLTENEIVKTKENLGICHQGNIRKIPFSPQILMDKKSPFYKENHKAWQTVSWGTGSCEPLEYADNYGDYMCLEAPGYRDLMEKSVSAALNNCGYDGIYFDFLHPTVCANPVHHPYPHTTIDSNVGFLRNIRELTESSGKIFIGHDGWYPGTIYENFVDIAVVGEEINHLPELMDSYPTFQFMNATVRGICVTKLKRIYLESRGRRTYISLVKEYIVKCILNGQFMYPAIPWQWFFKEEARLAEDEKEGFLKLFKILKNVKLGDCFFSDYFRQKVVFPDNGYIKASVFWNTEKAIVIFGNADSGTEQACSAKIDLSTIKMTDADKYKLRFLNDNSEIVASSESLKKDGIKLSFKGYDYRIVEIKKADIGG
jgi:hypothetical protein